MKQIFISGASMTYGVGGKNGGWADMLKRKIHADQYDDDYTGDERVDVFNFARSGMIFEEVTESLERDILLQKHEGSESIIMLSVGLNNSKQSVRQITMFQRLIRMLRS